MFFSKQIKFKNIRYLLDIIEQEQIDIIHTNFIEYNYSLFLIKNIFHRNIKIVGQFQNHYLPPNNIYRNFKIFITKNIYDKIIGVSSSVEKSILDAGIPEKKITCIHNSLAHTRLNNYETISLADDTTQKVILMFGWPFHRKGVDIALDVVKEMNEKGHNILLAISLSGGQNVIEEQIKQKLSEIPKWVKLLNAREDVATYYNAAKIFISPSREEGLTFAVLEASYCKCMVIVSEIGGNPQDIPFIGKFKIEDTLQFKKEIEKFLQKSEKEINEINSMQKEFVTTNYNIVNWAKSIVSIYNSVIIKWYR